MPRTLSSTNTANIALANTTPTYIVEFDFVPIIRISSRGDQTYNLNTYNGVSGFKASLAQDGLSGQLQWFNADYVYSDSMRKTAQPRPGSSSTSVARGKTIDKPNAFTHVLVFPNELTWWKSKADTASIPRIWQRSHTG